MHLIGKTSVPVWLVLAIFTVALSLALLLWQNDPQNAVGVLVGGFVVSYLASMAERPAPTDHVRRSGHRSQRRHHHH